MMHKEQLDELLGGVDFLEKILGVRIDKVGVFDGFLAIQFTNGYAFIIPKNEAPEPIDRGRYFIFKELPERIKKWGISCQGYYVEFERLAILIAPINNCSGSMDIVVSRPVSKMGVADVWQASLFSMLDKKEGLIEYKGRIIGMLSRARVSPIAHLALEKLEDLIRAGAKFTIEDDKTIVTAWRTRFEFGVKPVFYNPITIDFDRVKQELTWKKISFDDKLDKVRVFFSKIPLEINEILLRYKIGEDYEYGKAMIIKGISDDYSFVLLVGKYINEYSGDACIGEALENLALLLLTNAQKICLGESEEPLLRKDVKISGVKEPEPFLVGLGIIANLLLPGCKLYKIKAKKINAFAFIGERNDESLALVVSK